MKNGADDGTHRYIDIRRKVDKIHIGICHNCIGANRQIILGGLKPLL